MATGPMYVGQWPATVPYTVAWIPSQFFYDSVYQTLNNTSFDYNFVVVQSSQGECILSLFDPPDTEYWVVNDFTITDDNQVLLYNVYFPGWSACLEESDEDGNPTYYQVRCCPYVELMVALLSELW
jgi:hypothetical protein